MTLMLNPYRLIILVLFSAIMHLSSYAQQVNEHGLKMVSEVELYDNGLNYDLKFEYSSKGNLIGIKCYGHNFETEKYELKYEYRLTNGRLIFKDYEEDDNIYKYDFDLDWNNHITRITYTAIAGQDLGSKWEMSYSYEPNPLNNSYYLCRKVMREWNTNTQTKTFVFTYERCWEYELRDGCVVNKDSEEIINKERINDTNLSIWGRLPSLNMFSCGIERCLYLTEWMGKHNRYMPIADNSKYDKYKYLYDEDDNLSEVYLYEWGKWEKYNGEYGWGIKRSVKLKYVY
ncbi:MAG: hypothetical protein HDR86_09495 [Bacteroides sp.]|nr:hypothetical protein [Bacteroides sp.]